MEKKGRPATDLAGRRFGRLRAISPVGRSKTGLIEWLCECDCGNLTIVRSNSLRTKNTRSCGCMRIETAYKMLDSAIEASRKGQLKALMHGFKSPGLLLPGSGSTRKGKPARRP